MIRKAVASDVPRLVRMAGNFIAATGGDLPFDPDYLESSFYQLLSNPQGLVQVLDLDGVQGVLCAVASRSIWSPVYLACEQGFWIEPPSRGRWGLRMLQSYVSWAVTSGCQRVSMIAFADNPMDRLYQKAGFKLSEFTYSRIL